MKQKKYITWLLIFVIIQCIINIYCIMCILKLNNDITEFKKWETIQINSLWDNMQNMQNAYSDISDLLYNPENPNWLRILGQCIYLIIILGT